MAQAFRRPDLFVPLSVRFATGKTGSAIQGRYGTEGLAVWAAYLAACKLHRPEGEIVYASEPEGWALLGIDQPPGFTLDAFFTYTGKLKKTRKQRSGKLTYVICTAWSRWTNAQKQEASRQRKARSRAQTERDIDRDQSVTRAGHAAGHKRDLEVRSRSRTSKGRPKLRTPRANGLPPAQQHLLDKLLTHIGDHADEGTEQVLRSYVTQATEAQIARVLESAQTHRPRNIAAYIVGALRDELANAGGDEPWPGEPDTDDRTGQAT